MAEPQLKKKQICNTAKASWAEDKPPFPSSLSLSLSPLHGSTTHLWERQRRQSSLSCGGTGRMGEAGTVCWEGKEGAPKSGRDLVERRGFVFEK